MTVEQAQRQYDAFKRQGRYPLRDNTGDPQWGDRHLEAERPCGIETRSIAADPRFVDPEHDNFDLRPDSPAHRLGFVPIPLHQIGRAAGRNLETAERRNRDHHG